MTRFSIKNLLNRNVYTFFIFGFNILLIILLLNTGLSHFATNDDVTLNNIAVGNYGNHNKPYLVFSNICYGYFLSILYNLFPSLNWYSIIPITIALFCICLLTMIFIYLFSVKVGIIINFVVLIGFSKPLFLEFQFTHFAAFFSAVGVFILFICCAKELKHRILLSGAGVIISLCGYFFRCDSFYSVIPVVMVGVIYVSYTQKIWKWNLAEIIKRFCPWLILLGLIILFGIINYVTYNMDPEWKYYTEYNFYRSQLLDYDVPDYEIYKDEYSAMGIDQLDYEMFCSWDYADINKFSLETIKEIYQLKKEVDGKNIFVVDVVKQFVKNLITSYSEFTLIPFTLVISIIYFVFAKRGWWLLFSLGVVQVELLYLSIIGRHIFRSYFGVWSVYIFVLLYYTFSERSLKICKRTILVSLLGIIIIYLPNIYAIWSDRQEIGEELNQQAEKYEWRTEISGDQGSLYVCDTLFGYMPSTLSSLSLVQHYNHNLYALGGWTCPSPLQEYLLNYYGIQEGGIYKGLIDDSKNVYYIEGYDEGRVERQLQYIRKEYDQDVELEIVNRFGNVNIYRFFVDEQCDIKNSYYTDSILYDINDVTLNNEGLYIGGWCKVDGYDTYKQNVWFEIRNPDTQAVDYIRGTKVVRKDVSVATGIQHDAAAGVECMISMDLLESSNVEVRLIIENNGKVLINNDPIYSWD